MDGLRGHTFSVMPDLIWHPCRECAVYFAQPKPRSTLTAWTPNQVWGDGFFCEVSSLRCGRPLALRTLSGSILDPGSGPGPRLSLASTLGCVLALNHPDRMSGLIDMCAALCKVILTCSRVDLMNWWEDLP